MLKSFPAVREAVTSFAEDFLTDGEDTSSYSPFSDTTWFAHSMRVPIFSITLRTEDAHRMPKFADEEDVRFRYLLATLASGQQRAGRCFGPEFVRPFVCARRRVPSRCGGPGTGSS